MYSFFYDFSPKGTASLDASQLKLTDEVKTKVGVPTATDFADNPFIQDTNTGKIYFNKNGVVTELGDASIDSSGFKAVGNENTLGLNKNDDTVQKIVSKIEDFVIKIPKAFDNVVLVTDVNLAKKQAIEPTVTVNDLLFEFKAQDGTSSYIVTPLDTFIDLTAIKKIHYKTTDAKEATLKIVKIDDSVMELDLSRFYTKDLNDIWKDDIYPDYYTKGATSFSQLDTVYTRKDEFRLHAYRSLMRFSIHTSGDMTYKNGKLNTEKVTLMKLPSGATWNIDAITDLRIGENKVVYFATTKPEILQGRDKAIPQSSLKIGNIDTFIPTDTNFQIGYVSNGVFSFASGQSTSIDANGTNDATVTFVGATVDGLATKTIKEKTMEYTSFLDLPAGKMLDTVDGAKIIDATTGLIAYHTDSGDIAITATLKDVPDLDTPGSEEAFVRINSGVRNDAAVYFTAERDMYVLVTWNGTGWRRSSQWGWLNTRYSGATALRGHRGKCLLHFGSTIHQTLLPDTGYFFVKKGDTARFWLEKTNTINIDKNDRCNIVAREIARRAPVESVYLQVTDPITVAGSPMTTYTLAGKKIARVDVVDGGKVTLTTGRLTETVTFDEVDVGQEITIEYYN